MAGETKNGSAGGRENGTADIALRLTDNIPVGTYVLHVTPGVAPRFAFASNRLLEMVGLGREEVLADAASVFRTVHPDDRDAFVASSTEAAAANQPLLWEGRILVRGEVRWMTLESNPRVLPEGGTAWEGVLIDRTRRKAAEDRLVEREAQVRRQLAEIEAIYATAPVGLCSFDRDLRWVRLNDRIAEMNGVPLRDHVGKTPREVIPDIGEQAEAALRTILETGEPLLNFEMTGTTPAQPSVQRCWLERWMPIKDADGAVIGVSVAAEEITDRKRAELALVEAQREIARAEERQRLIADMHDGFGSQLASALTQVERGELSAADTAKLLRECVADLYLVVDTLRDHDDSVAAALADYRARCERRLVGERVAVDWDLELDDAPPLPARVILQILRVVQEALQNALQHANARRVSIRARCPASGPLTVSVTDDGVGLPQPLRPGRGLKHIAGRARSIGATLTVARREPEHGTIVSLVLPLASGVTR